ncbi:peptidase M14 [Roridomyces roridus]|uniref:Peptidase M14 n=1 Tax=Roridomyces roridus TaxID=1738132 RepID=A0AAD7BBU8_9AGAR|nr:peptidase M14 [Roridomyces roridus]
MHHALLWSAALTLPSLAVAVLSQQPLSAPAASLPSGILRRYTPSDELSLLELLAIAEEYDLDVWQTRTNPVPLIDIYTPPSLSSDSLPSELLTTPHELTNVSVPTLPTAWDWGEETDIGSLENSTFHSAYHPQNEIDSFMHSLARTYPEQVKIEHLGHSAEGREMLGVKISAVPTKGKKRSAKKLGFVVLGPQHAREWVATSSALYMAHALVTPANETGSLAPLLDIYDFHIIPSPNPDGYIYTWEADRFWYKNRQIVGPGAKCTGIDMNRNWGAHWKPHSDSPLFRDNKSKNSKKKEPADPCSHWYPGHRAFEAAEVNNLANYVTRVQGVGKGSKGGVVGFVEMRSYGQMLAAPYSYKCDKLPKDAENQMEALLGAANAGRAVHGRAFSTGTLCSLLYSAPGNILDYIYGEANVKYAYSAFLRDTGTYGFSLPAEWIRPVGEETGAMVAYLARFVAKQMGVGA